MTDFNGVTINEGDRVRLSDAFLAFWQRMGFPNERAGELGWARRVAERRELCELPGPERQPRPLAAVVEWSDGETTVVCFDNLTAV